MFRKLRKWYFKIYHLFRFLGIFILIFGIQKNVYAEECINLLESNKYFFKSGNPNYVYYSTTGNEITNFKLDTNKTYTFYFLDKEKFCNNICLFQTHGITEMNVHDKTYITFKPKQENSFLGLRSNFSFASFFPWENTREMWLVEGDSICEPSSEPEEPQENEVYSSFLTLYTNKLSYLATGFTENPYLLAMIGIIFTWVVLELFLKILHLRGGYKR